MGRSEDMASYARFPVGVAGRTVMRSSSRTGRKSCMDTVTTACALPETVANSTSTASPSYATTTAPRSPARSPASGRSWISTTESSSVNLRIAFQVSPRC